MTEIRRPEEVFWPSGRPRRPNYGSLERERIRVFKAGPAPTREGIRKCFPKDTDAESELRYLDYMLLWALK